MGDVLVRKARIQPQFSQGQFQFPIEMGGRRGGDTQTLTSITDRRPFQAVAARRQASKAKEELGRQPLPSSESDPNKAKQIAVTRAGLKDKIDEGQSRSLREQLGADSFERLVKPRRTLASPLRRRPGFRDDVAERAAMSAGKVGVRGAKLGRDISSGLGIGLGILSGAAALSDASAAGQDFGGALAGAGLTGISTGTSVMEHADPALSSLGAYAGSRLGEKGSIVRQGIEANRAARAARPTTQPVTVKPPVAVTSPTVAAPTRPVLPTKPIFTGQGPTTQMRYSQQLTPDQLRARQANIETSAQYNMGPTANQQAELRHISRQLNPSTAAQPFNPQVREGAMDMFNQPVLVQGSGPQTQFNVPGSPSPAPAAPAAPVGVQSTLNVGEAASEFKPPEGSVEAMKETGAADKAAADFMGMGSMASQSSAGNQQKPEEDEEGQVQGG